jgi:hypothetical protein
MSLRALAILLVLAVGLAGCGHYAPPSWPAEKGAEQTPAPPGDPSAPDEDEDDGA